MALLVAKCLPSQCPLGQVGLLRGMPVRIRRELKTLRWGPSRQCCLPVDGRHTVPTHEVWVELYYTVSEGPVERTLQNCLFEEHWELGAPSFDQVS